MKHLLSSRFLPLLIFLLSSSSAFSQLDPEAQRIGIWFLEERFILADQNDDALLEKAELESFPNEFAYYLEDHTFKASDKNQDGFLSFNETLSRAKSENIYRYNLERKKLRTLAREHPYLAQVDVKYLKRNPELVQDLFGNLVWLYENQHLASKVYKDKMWMKQHPEVTVSLHRNLRWMASNPNEAKNMYRDRSVTQYLPELLAWRADHNTFMRKNPKLTQVYQMGFFQTGIRIDVR
ncbi:MAG: hypothetical protein AAF587_28880 [Bacteroidota bacterium]